MATPDPMLYRVSFLRDYRSMVCPVGDCVGRPTTRTKLRIRFVHHHMRYTVVILEEGNLPRPRCLACAMFVPWELMRRRHSETDIFAWVVESKIQWLVEEEARAGKVAKFRAYDKQLEIVSAFKYLGRLLTATNDDWMDVIANLWKARKSWYCLDWILGR